MRPKIRDLAAIALLASTSTAITSYAPLLPRQSNACSVHVSQLSSYAQDIAGYVNQLSALIQQVGAGQTGRALSASPAIMSAAVLPASPDLTTTITVTNMASISTIFTTITTTSASTLFATISAGASSVPGGYSSGPASGLPSGSASGTASSSPSINPTPAPALTPLPQAPGGNATGTKSYLTYTGNGSAAAGWPTFKDWYPSFGAMFHANRAVLQASCGGFSPPQANNSAAELQSLRKVIHSLAELTTLDARFVLAITLQESGGCVRVKTTVAPDGSVVNPGLFQSHNGAGSCNRNASMWDGVPGNGTGILNPCPLGEILQMVADGVMGTPYGDGLIGTTAESQKTGAKGAQLYYQAARRYNSGAANVSDLNAGIGSTNCYAMDIANRLIGWNQGMSGCKLNA